MFLFINFFNRHPAVYFGFFAVLGTSAALYDVLVSLVFAICLALPYLTMKQINRPLLGLVCLALNFYVTASTVKYIALDQEEIEGYALLSIDQIAQKSLFNRSVWQLKGKILHFWDHSLESVLLQGIPYTINIKDRDRPAFNHDYLVKCRLRPSFGKRVLLKPLPNTPWIATRERGTFVETRYRAKEAVKRWIQNNYSSTICATFLTGLITGEFDDAQIRQDFGRFGLLHLLAISGFHFGILARLLKSLLQILLPPRLLSIVIILLLSCYFFFLGWGPSVVRAWMTIMIFYGAYLGKRTSSPINSLGFATLAAVTIDPLLIENLGFQFSVLTTAAILLFNERCLNFMDRIFRTRSLLDLMQWSVVDQFAYIFIKFIKRNLTLALSTSIVAIPISLYYFQYFPLLSLIYNVFFPFLVSISISLMLFGFIFSPLILGSWIHQLNDWFTSFILNMTYDVPNDWNWQIQTNQFTATIVISLLIFIFLINIYFPKSRNALNL